MLSTMEKHQRTCVREGNLSSSVAFSAPPLPLFFLLPLTACSEPAAFPTLEGAGAAAPWPHVLAGHRIPSAGASARSISRSTGAGARSQLPGGAGRNVGCSAGCCWERPWGAALIY